MKWLRYGLLACGFTFQVIIPLIIFGKIIPYSHDTAKTGLTGAGLIAISIVLLVAAFKGIGLIKERCKMKWIAPMVTLALTVTIWSVLGVGIDRVVTFLQLLSHYWWLALIFIAIGGIFYIVEGFMRDGQ